MGILEAERSKYEEIWSVPEYREHSPGLENVQNFLDVLSPKRGDTLIDIGCGEGIAGLEFAAHGLDVGWLDITDAGLKPEVDRRRFIQKPLWDDWVDYDWQYGFCCDVMEHIPTEYTMLVADRIIEACDVTWFQIAFEPDVFGSVIGKPLHLTVKPFGWWLDRLQNIGDVIDARDLCGRGMFVVTRK
jgi:hypothetical protein